MSVKRLVETLLSKCGLRRGCIDCVTCFWRTPSAYSLSSVSSHVEHLESGHTRPTTVGRRDVACPWRGGSGTRFWPVSP